MLYYTKRNAVFNMARNQKKNVGGAKGGGGGGGGGVGEEVPSPTKAPKKRKKWGDTSVAELAKIQGIQGMEISSDDEEGGDEGDEAGSSWSDDQFRIQTKSEKKMNEMMEKMAEIASGIKDEKITIEHAVSTMIVICNTMVHANFDTQKQLQNANAILREKVKVLDTRLERLERKEIVSAKAGIVILGVPEPDGETDLMLLDTIRTHLGEALSVKPEAIIHAYRLKPSKVAIKRAKEMGKKAMAPALVRFHSIKEKFAAFREIRNITKNDKTKDWKLNQEIPPSLRKKNQELLKYGESLRKDANGEKNGVRTRIIWRQLDLELQMKTPTSQEYKKVDVDLESL